MTWLITSLFYYNGVYEYVTLLTTSSFLFFISKLTTVVCSKQCLSLVFRKHETNWLFTSPAFVDIPIVKYHQVILCMLWTSFPRHVRNIFIFTYISIYYVIKLTPRTYHSLITRFSRQVWMKKTLII